MLTGLKTDSLVLCDVFDEPFVFAIPPYQRSYSWTTKEVGQFLEDVASAAGIEDEALACPDYFLGTVLLLDPNSQGATESASEGTASTNIGVAAASKPKPLDVVDGQQRLLTVSLLARVLEEKLTDQALIRRLRTMIVTRDGEPRIDVFDDDRPFFDTLILFDRSGASLSTAPSPTDGDDRGERDGAELEVAYDYLRQEVSALSDADQHALARYLVDRCHVVVIITRDIDRAHLMFTVLNDRGRPLQRKDILKVEVLKSIEPEHEIEALNRWDASAAKLGNDFESLFSHIRTIHATGRPQIIAAMRTLVRQRGCLPFVTDVLAPMADAFHLVRRFPEAGRRSDQHPQLATALTSLNRFGNADWVAPAMIAMSNFEADPIATTRIVCEIERLTFLLKVLAIGGSKRNKRSSQLIQALTGNDPSEIVQAFSITREETRAVAFHLRDIHRRNAMLAKLILMRIEDELAGAPLMLSTTELTVEHILPQRPSPASDWRRVFGDRREACQNSLGNLALVSPRLNERMRNKEFADKLSLFASSDTRLCPPLLTNDDIIDAVGWGPDQVWAREARLLQVLGRLWRIDGLGEAREVDGATRSHEARIKTA